MKSFLFKMLLASKVISFFCDKVHEYESVCYFLEKTYKLKEINVTSFSFLFKTITTN